VYAELAESAAQLPESAREAVEHLADAMKERAVLPVLGAGASHKLIPLAHELAGDIWAAIDGEAFGALDLPSDENALRGDLSKNVYPDLGKVADIVYLHTGSNVQALDAVRFGDPARWPDGDQAAATASGERHHWAYRILARMTRDRLFVEAITFNYDCHYEGGLINEGFSETPRLLGFAPWPEQFTVIADAESHAQLTTRGDFVLNKVHGCVSNWRSRVGGRTDATAVNSASEAIVLRWSQLLDWRRDNWSRDLFRDRARRHVVLLIGFSGTDAVIHSSLRSVMEEVRSIDVASASAATARISAIDKYPRTLTLQMLVRAGGGDDAVIPVGDPPSGLPEILLVLHSALLEHHLKQYGGGALPLPTDTRDRLRRLAVSGPAMVRLSVELLTRAGVLRGMNRSRSRRNELDETYVPLAWDPYLTVQTFRTREELAKRLGVPAEPDGSSSEPVALRRGGVDGRRFIPVGVGEEVLSRALQSSQSLDELSPFLPIAAGAIPILVCLDERSELQFWNAETGTKVRL
jgi:hypothetical protein